MTSGPPESGDAPAERVDLTKGVPDATEADAPLDFDPYRYGRPEHPVPPEFAPPGYQPPPPTAAPASEQPPPSAAWSPYGPSSPYGPAPGYQLPPPPGYGPPSGAPPQGYGPPPGYPPAPGYPPPVWPAAAGQQYPGQPYPGHAGYGAPTQVNNGKSVWTLVLGIGSIVLCWLAYLDAALIVPAIVLGSMVLSDKRSTSRGMAVAGLICTAVGTVAAVALTIWITHLLNECPDLSGSDLRECVRHKI